MARLASQSQGGYYVTPEDEMRLVCERLRFEGSPTLNLLDPCCGEGLAIKQVADYLLKEGAAKVNTFGVELEEGRAEVAKKILNKIVSGGYENLRASNEVFSFLWLNPPYDNARNGFRMEFNFLQDLTKPNKYLQVGGLLGFCIPQYVLADCAQILANRFDGIRVYRFTDANYHTFSQVVVFGYKSKGRIDPEKAAISRKALETLSQVPFEEIPTLEENDGVEFLIPEAAGEVKLFRGSLLDPREIAKDIEKSTVWEEFENLLIPLNLRHDSTMKRPVLPLKPSHMGVAIAAGAVGGNMTNHILVGLTAKKVDIEVHCDDDEKVSKTKNIHTERYVTKIRIYSQEEGTKGVHTLE